MGLVLCGDFHLLLASFIESPLPSLRLLSSLRLLVSSRLEYLDSYRNSYCRLGHTLLFSIPHWLRFFN